MGGGDSHKSRPTWIRPCQATRAPPLIAREKIYNRINFSQVLISLVYTKRTLKLYNFICSLVYKIQSQLTFQISKHHLLYFWICLCSVLAAIANACRSYNVGTKSNVGPSFTHSDPPLGQVLWIYNGPTLIYIDNFLTRKMITSANS